MNSPILVQQSAVPMRLATVEHAAVVLDMSVAGLRKAIGRGSLPPGCVIRLGRRVRLDLDALAAWLRDPARAGGGA